MPNERPTVVMTGEQVAREELAREMRELNAAGYGTSEPGGRYRTADGVLRNAHGDPLDAPSEATASEQPSTPEPPAEPPAPPAGPRTKTSR
jgi:hypothetical protein